jgi:hypothetical protein
MGKGTIAGYFILFIFLFLLIAASPAFILVFFIAIIVVIAYNVNKRRKSKVSLSRTYPKDYQNKKVRDTGDTKNPVPIDNKKNYGGIFSDHEQIDQKNDEKNTHDILKQNKRLHDIQDSFQKNYKEIIEKKSFNRYYWNFRYDEHIENKKRKFLEAIDLCETNNLGSKAKIRRLRMKMDRWNVENERDIEALMPDYEYLLGLIEEFETR